LISSAFYTPTASSSPQCTYWTRKEYSKPLAELTKSSRQKIVPIPAPLSFDIPAVQTAHVVTLLNPVYDPVTTFTFSAGTRFTLAKERPDGVLVWRYIPSTQTFSSMPLKATDYSVHTTQKTKEECIALFVAIARSWAHPDSAGRAIPYVWGGVSIGDRYPKNGFITQTSTADPSLTYYEIPSLPRSPKMGLDCSGLILRAAQLAGIPYFFKNTKTIDLHMQSLKRHEKLSEGDLILVQGHVMIVGSLTNNTLIEARAYDQGYGKVQELPVKAIFKDVPTLQRLVELHHAKQPVDRLDVHGVISDHFPSITCIRITSAWELLGH
jgi:cell wall-associated NlpC family hydrolase